MLHHTARCRKILKNFLFVSAIPCLAFAPLPAAPASAGTPPLVGVVEQATLLADDAGVSDEFGYAAAMSYIILIIVNVFAIALIYFLSDREAKDQSAEEVELERVVAADPLSVA